MIREIWVGRSVWYFVPDEMRAYRCKSCASGQYAAATGEVKEVIEDKGNYYIPYRNKWVKAVVGNEVTL